MQVFKIKHVIAVLLLFLSIFILLPKTPTQLIGMNSERIESIYISIGDENFSTTEIETIKKLMKHLDSIKLKFVFKSGISGGEPTDLLIMDFRASNRVVLLTSNTKRYLSVVKPHSPSFFYKYIGSDYNNDLMIREIETFIKQNESTFSEGIK